METTPFFFFLHFCEPFNVLWYFKHAAFCYIQSEERFYAKVGNISF